MDEAFIPFSDMVHRVLAVDGDFYDEENGVRTYISEMEVGTPIELDVQVDENGKVKLGAVPPLYRVYTSFRPSYHSVTINAEYSIGPDPHSEYTVNGNRE
jgi:hypothetical protein